MTSTEVCISPAGEAAELLVRRARQCVAAGDHKTAAQLMRQAMKSYPYLPSLWGQIARLHLAIGEMEQAVEAAGNELEIRLDSLEALSIIIAKQKYISQSTLGSEDGPKLRLVFDLVNFLSSQQAKPV